MLVFISDLHFEDESAGKHNVPTRAFEGVFEDLQRHSKKVNAEEIKIVFLGDIFDLNRTTYWLDVDESERPWGDVEKKSAKIEEHANKIMDAIIEKNRATFELLRGSLQEQFKFPVEIERLYIPGNHDRLCNMFSSLREKVRQCLAIPGGSEPFSHTYDDMLCGNKYGVLARHGHEYDTWNFEGTPNLTEADYAQIPIGDLITTEIAARLPYEILRLAGDSISLKRNLEEIENVRPYSALFNWLFYQVKTSSQHRDRIEQALHKIVDNFNGLAYLKRWYQRHDKWYIPYDDADKIQAAITMFKHLDLEFAEGLMKIYSRIFGSPSDLPMDNSDKALRDAAQEFLSRTSDYCYYVLGHTHNPMQVPIRITSSKLEQVYVNTGTWRTRHVQGLSGGFISWKNLTYVILYTRQENPRQLFETWTGTLKEV